MQDDATRGSRIPLEIDGEPWRREAIGDHRRARTIAEEVRVGLTAVAISVRQDQPVVLASQAGADRQESWRLPAGGFCPIGQPSLEAALREVVLATTGRELGHLEQLMTDYASLDRAENIPPEGMRRQLSVSYLALTRADSLPLAGNARWLDCYELLPWEDFRGGRPAVLASHLVPGLEAWCAGAAGEPRPSPEIDTPMSRGERVAVSFGLSGRSWDDQRVVDRLDIVMEAGLLPAGPPAGLSSGDLRLVAAGLGRLRAKIRYRPVVFELLPPEFTLFELQRTVEAVLGPTLHKQNFRRLVEGTGLVEPTGDVRNNTGGRPAKTFRFRREVMLERPAPGVHVRPGRAA